MQICCLNMSQATFLFGVTQCKLNRTKYLLCPMSQFHNSVYQPLNKNCSRRVSIFFFLLFFRQNKTWQNKPSPIFSDKYVKKSKISAAVVISTLFLWKKKKERKKKNHYENMPIQINWKFYHQKMNIFR